jgi:ABC-type multidrug transport system ATPase subunit
MWVATTNKTPNKHLNSILLAEASKFFNQRAVFQNLNMCLKTGDACAITGPNGSGKSTLLKVLSGFTGLTHGTIHWQSDQGLIEANDIYSYCSLAAPYLDLFESFTLNENIGYYGSLKGFRDGMKQADVLDFIGLNHASNKLIRDFSSGMKQRTKLGLAFCADTDLLLLDEPLSNLDVKGYEWYRRISSEFLSNRIVVVGSNLEGDETRFCNQEIKMTLQH